MGKKLLTELLVNMGIDSPTFPFTETVDFISTVQIGGVSYVGGVAKSKREAEAKAVVVAFQAIEEQVGDPQFLLQLQAEGRVSPELEQSTEECKDIKPELKKETEA
ncbi:double-stranded RNA-binding protein 8 [Cryptomeria japonica]|uniref:double-stranded RNA-binding protein 8 n=1 Tax=Cryptomeria japonica TaxID=3369 RepID=UPI0027DA2E65|nr:double-stranded RNA-binding protein 8 [Cryptomeria japonica]